MMAMLVAGARGNTRTQLQKTMKFPDNEEELFETYRQYIQKLNVITQLTLKQFKT